MLVCHSLVMVTEYPCQEQGYSATAVHGVARISICSDTDLTIGKVDGSDEQNIMEKRLERFK